MKKNKSFTLIEVILAISIFTLVIGGSFVLIQQTVNAVSLANSKLVAFYLAQEGIELVRNVRDNNWLKQRTSPAVSWDDDLSVGDWEIDYDDLVLVQYQNPGRPLYYASTTGFYFYSNNPLPDYVKTGFTRKINISQTGNDDLYVKVQVQWTEKNRVHNVKVDEHLYNWYGY